MIRHFRFIIILLIIFTYTIYARDKAEILLWPDGAPGAKTDGGEEIVTIYEKTGDHLISNVHYPSITPCIPSRDSPERFRSLLKVAE